MVKITRTPTKATGGITLEEKAKMDAISQEWIGIAMRTDPIEAGKITAAITALYAKAGLKAKRIVIAPSPIVMAFAYGAAAAIWHRRKSDAATEAATEAATRAATRAATDAATSAATRAATRDATGAFQACFALAGDLGVSCAGRWWNGYQGGAMWAGECCYLVAARDVLGLHLPDFAPWEESARHGAFRVMHEEFCIVSDFPEFIRVDDLRRPHCETGPSHRWRDGWSLYHWHGTRVPAAWIEDKANVSPKEVLGMVDANVRAAGIQIFGWDRLMSEMDAKVVDRHPEGMLGGELLAVDKRKIDPNASGTMKLLRAECPRNGTICFRVPDEISTAHEAQAWSRGLPPEIFQLPLTRT